MVGNEKVYSYLQNIFIGASFSKFYVYFCRKVLFNEHIDRNYQPLPEDRPGGFNWGGDDVAADNNDAAAGAPNADDNNDQRAGRPAQN